MYKNFAGILIMIMASALFAGEHIDLLPETSVDTVTQNDTAKITIRVDPKAFSHSIILTSSIGVITPSILTPPFRDSVVTLIVLSRQCINGQNPIQITAMNGSVVLDEIRCAIFGKNIEDMFEWTVFDTSNSGLPVNNVRSIAFEDNGTKWFATYRGGLAAFDGDTWKVYNKDNSSLLTDQLYHITIDKNGKKWLFGGDYKVRGVFVFNDTTCRQYSTDNSEIPDNHIHDIMVDHTGTKWISTKEGGVASFNDVKWTIYNTENSALLSNEVYRMAEDSDGTKWFVTSQRVVAFDGRFWSVYTKENSGLIGNVSCIAVDRNGTKWFGYSNNGMSSFNGADWTHYSRSSPGGIQKMVIDSDGTKWFIKWRNYGINEIASSIDNKEWIIYNSTNSPLPSAAIDDIAIEADGTKWFATTKGVVRVKTIKNPRAALTASTAIDTLKDGQYAQVIVTIDPSRFSDTVALASTHGHFLSGARLVPPFTKKSATLTVLSQDLSRGANTITITVASRGNTVSSTHAELYLKTSAAVIETRGQRTRQVIQVRPGGEIALRGFSGKRATVSLYLPNGKQVFMRTIPLKAGIGIFKLPGRRSGIGIIKVENMGKRFRRVIFRG